MIGQDILSQRSLTKSALFRQAFAILCNYPSQEVSYTTLLGQLQDKGNTDLIKNYIELYEGAFLFKTLSKYSAQPVKIKSSSPKMLSMCPALYTLAKGPSAIRNPEERGLLFEAAVGADLVRSFGHNVFYWRDKDSEVDFVIKEYSDLFAIEVKSGRRKPSKGLAAFSGKFPQAKSVFLTPENYAEFSQDPRAYLRGVGN